MPMKNSKMTDEWIARAISLNPMQLVPETGFIRTMPVRLSFTNIFTPQKRQPNDAPDKKQKYGVTLLFPPGSDAQIQAVLMPVYWAKMREKFPQNIGADGQPFGLHSPFHNQAEKQNLAGYTPGLTFLNTTTDFKPQVVDTMMNPIVDESRVYPGVWAFVTLNCYTYSDPRKKGVGFGLQSLMILQDDEPLAGGGSDPKKDFAGVKIDANYNPAAAFGAPPGVPASILPPAQPVYAPPAAAPQVWVMPQNYAAPPAAQQWAPPPVLEDDGV